MKKNLILLTMLAAVVLIQGCWYYSFTGGSIPGVESVAIPMFKDNSTEFQLKEKLQQQLVTKFQSENIFKIENPNSADAILSGVITNVTDMPVSVNRQEQASQTEIRISVSIKLDERVSGKSIVSVQVSGVAQYSSVSGRETAIERAINQLTQEISEKILSGW